MRFQDIPKQISDGNYKVNIAWNYLLKALDDYRQNEGLDLDPIFQRPHVWTIKQQRSYVEYILSGGRDAREIRFNSKNFQSSNTDIGPLVIVDGKQRIEAVCRFMRNDLAVFGGYKLSDFEDKPNNVIHDFVFYINNLSNELDIYKWYIQINAGGVSHLPSEINKVEALINPQSNYFWNLPEEYQKTITEFEKETHFPFQYDGWEKYEEMFSRVPRHGTGSIKAKFIASLEYTLNLFYGRMEKAHLITAERMVMHIRELESKLENS